MSPKDAIGADPQFGGTAVQTCSVLYIRVNETNLHALGLFYNNSYDAVFMENELVGYWDSYCYYQADGGDIDLFLYERTGDGFGIGALYLSDGTSGNADETVFGYMVSTMHCCLELEQNCDDVIRYPETFP